MKKRVLHILCLFILVTLVIVSSYIRRFQPGTEIDELFFCLNNGVENSDWDPVVEGLRTCLPLIVILFPITLAMFYDLSFGHSKKIYPFKTIIENRKLFTIVFAILSFITILYNMNVVPFIHEVIIPSNFIEDNYVNPKNVEIELPQKRNLIYILLESYESTLLSKEHGGSWNKDIIPESYELLNDKDSVYFTSKKNKIGLKTISNASTTTASIFANHSALPFKVSIFKHFNKNKKFYNGAYTLGDYLYEQGYHNELISAAAADFGSFKELFGNHGKYNIIDIDSYKEYDLPFDKNDLGPWGFNDNYMYETAKTRLNLLSKSDQPFNLTMVGIDTHFPYGFNGDYTIKEYNQSLADAYRTESKILYEFISWVKEQDFYDNTTIVIMGDHYSMQQKFFDDIDIKDRYVYNLYINSVIKPVNNKNRTYTALDTYPSIISAMGGHIKGDRIGLGTNIFSDKETLAEKYGLSKLDKELRKKSDFYYKKFDI